MRVRCFRYHRKINNLTHVRAPSRLDEWRSRAAGSGSRIRDQPNIGVETMTRFGEAASREGSTCHSVGRASSATITCRPSVDPSLGFAITRRLSAASPFYTMPFGCWANTTHLMSLRCLVPCRCPTEACGHNVEAWSTTMQPSRALGLGYGQGKVLLKPTTRGSLESPFMNLLGSSARRQT